MLPAMYGDEEYDAEGTPIQNKTPGKKSLPKVMDVPPPPPKLPDPPKEIVVATDLEESTVDTSTLNSDGLILPSTEK